MRHLASFRAPALLLALLGALPGAWATFPGDNGVIVYGDGHVIQRIAGDGNGPSTVLALGDNPKVSPDGRRVAFTRTQPFWTELFVMNIDGSNPVLLGVGSHPAWAPDGQRLAYYVDAGTSGNSAIYVIDTTTAAKTLLGRVPTFGGGVARLDWSPVGDRLVYSMQGSSQGYYMSASTGASVALNPNLLYASWLPDAGSLVGGVQNAPCAYRMGSGGGPLQQLQCPGQWPSVSPDGSRLLSIAANAPGVAGPLASQALAGGNPTRIAATAVTADWSRAPRAAMRTVLIGNQWSAPVPLGNDPGSYVSRVAVAVMPDNGAQGQALQRALGIGVDGRVVERAMTTQGQWGGWTRVPGTAGNPAAGIVAKRVAIAGALDGSAQVVIVGSDNLVYHAMRYANGSWSGFGLLDGDQGAPNFAARDVAIAIMGGTSSSPGVAQVVANGLDAGYVYHRVRWAGGNWSPWGRLGTDVAQTGSLAIATAGNGDAYVLATSPTRGVLRQVRRYSGTWDGWVQMSTDADLPLQGVSLALRSAPGQQADTAWVAFTAADGSAYSDTIAQPIQASAWALAPLPLAVADRVRSLSVIHSNAAGVELVLVQPQAQ